MMVLEKIWINLIDRSARWRILLIILMILVNESFAADQKTRLQASPVVYVIPFKGEVENGLLRVLKRGYHEAEIAGATYVLIEMDTPGGRVDAALQIVDLIINSKIPTAILVTGDATSAGAIISIAAEHIFIVEGVSHTIGTAAPVMMGGGESQVMEEKALSYVLAKVRSICEARGFSEEKRRIFEAMVDKDVEVKDPTNPDRFINEKGKLLTLTAREAERWGIITAIVKDRQECLKKLGLENAQILFLKEELFEQTARFLSSTLVSGILLTIGFLGIFIELQYPGHALAGIVGVAALVLFFWGHAIAGLAGWEGPLLFLIGIILLGLEVFVIPGFGVTGIIGILCILASLVVTLMNDTFFRPDFPQSFAWAEFSHALMVCVVSMILGAVGAMMVPLLFPFALQTRFGSFLLLRESEERSQGYHAAAEGLENFLGKKGIAISKLRPAGIAEIAGKRLDVVSQGEFITNACPIEVIKVEGRRIVVRKV